MTPEFIRKVSDGVVDSKNASLWEAFNGNNVGYWYLTDDGTPLAWYTLGGVGRITKWSKTVPSGIFNVPANCVSP